MNNKSLKKNTSEKKYFRFATFQNSYRKLSVKVQNITFSSTVIIRFNMLLEPIEM